MILAFLNVIFERLLQRGSPRQRANETQRALEFFFLIGCDTSKQSSAALREAGKPGATPLTRRQSVHLLGFMSRSPNFLS